MSASRSSSSHHLLISSDPTLDRLATLWTLDDRRRVSRTRRQSPQSRATSIWDQIQSALAEPAHRHPSSVCPCTTYKDLQLC